MKLLQLQATEETMLLDNSLYLSLVEKFNRIFLSTNLIEKPVIKKKIVHEDSQFYKKQVELVRTGIRTKATVLYITETGVLVNEDPVISLTLRFRNKRNKQREITANTVVSKIAIPKPADIISIAYCSDEPGTIAVL